ncbi:family 43 glycosylhydrolase [Luoshenia tenuis]|jgi:hypothetical protein|uniref:family 43 glycosylhydrolase n=1 Tax=Luoshenia tenuis TaxID=2763654 RepID=UPI003D8ECA1E
MALWHWRNTGRLADTDGKFLHSHGGHILLAEDGYYYLYGEYGEFSMTRQVGRKVSCYRSRNLTHWENCGVVLSVDTPRAAYHLTKHTNPTLQRNPGPAQEARWAGWNDRVQVGATIQRPKVLYNPKTKRYVMWMHWEDGKGFYYAHAAVASAKRPEGPYTYHGSFRPAGEMARDCTLFQDDDGTAYFIAAGRDNADLYIYRLTEDYMAVDECVKCLFPDQFREAPTLFKRNGVYFMLSSECMGAEPNQGMYSFSRELTGRWSAQRPLGSPTTYDTQPAFVFSIDTPQGAQYFYVGDRWNPSEFYRDARYMVLPLYFPDDTSIDMRWCDGFTFDPATGALQEEVRETGLSRIKSRVVESKGGYLYPAGDKVGCRKLDYREDALLWRLESADEDRYYIRHEKSGLRLTYGLDGKSCFLAAADTGYNQQFNIEALFDGACRILTQDGLALTVDQELPQAEMALGLAPRREIYDPAWGCDPQAFNITTVYPND